jgi:hypothetical protein
MKHRNTVAVWLRAFDRAGAAITPALLAMQDLHEIMIRHDPVARAALEALAEAALEPYLNASSARSRNPSRS